MSLDPLACDAQRDPEQWDRVWEARLSILSQRSVLLQTLSSEFREEVQDTEWVLDHNLNGYQFLLRQTCEVQRMMSYDALVHLVHDDFEKKWKRAKPHERGKHVLGALAAICSVAKDLNDARAYCPELRSTSLQSDGDAFLRLLRSAMLEETTVVPGQPRYVAHSDWDDWTAMQQALIQSEAEKVVLARMMAVRTKLICHILYFTMTTFLGHDPRPLVTTLEKRKLPPDYWRLNPNIIESIGYEAAKADAKANKADFFSRRGQERAVCSYIGCGKTAAEGSVKYPRCGRCFDKMKRQVSYCSRECQLADWKAGHKAVCGKPLDFDTVSQAVEHPLHGVAATLQSRIGPPQNGFKRPLALTAQIAQLDMAPEIEYILYNADNEVELFTIEDTFVRERFRQVRDVALTRGDPEHVGKIAHWMCMMYQKGGYDDDDISPDSIADQLGREFGLDVHGLVYAANRLQEVDPQHRPPLFQQGTPANP
ncbi:MYND-type domain-containing protein [Favolaschia claudopus]|uniref:MYND-type domain-containing protein n=1 Tax=Favolaschia claudopus TaxID=2862362 RepID=A0AAW0A8J4_9AGAR